MYLLGHVHADNGSVIHGRHHPFGRCTNLLRGQPQAKDEPPLAHSIPITLTPAD